MPDQSPSNQHRIGLHWGLGLPQYGALGGLDASVHELPPPPRLYYPLRSRDGAHVTPLVAAGVRVLRGQLIARSGDNARNASVHATTSGIIRGLEYLPTTTGGDKPDAFLVLAADGADSPEPAWPPLGSNATPDSIIDRVCAAGIIGLGGAGFATAVKIAAAIQGGVDTCIVNGVECEPYVTCDAALLHDDLPGVLRGVDAVRCALAWPRCVLAVSERFLATLNAKQPGFFEGWPGIEVVSVPDVYPMGSESRLVPFVTGRDVPRGGVPVDAGVLCLNVATVAAIGAAVRGRPMIARVVSVAVPALGISRNYRVRLGTPIQYLLEASQAAGASGAITVGGPMAGNRVSTAAAPITKTVNSVQVGVGLWPRGRAGESPCIRCAKCVEVCPEGLLPQELLRATATGDSARAMALGLNDCIECRCCDVVCPSEIPLVDRFRRAKCSQREAASARARADHAKQRYEARRARLADESAKRGTPNSDRAEASVANKVVLSRTLDELLRHDGRKTR